MRLARYWYFQNQRGDRLTAKHHPRTRSIPVSCAHGFDRHVKDARRLYTCFYSRSFCAAPAFKRMHIIFFASTLVFPLSPVNAGSPGKELFTTADTHHRPHDCGLAAKSSCPAEKSLRTGNGATKQQSFTHQNNACNCGCCIWLPSASAARCKLLRAGGGQIDWCVINRTSAPVLLVRGVASR